MHTPPDFSALKQAFAQQHAEFARLKQLLAGLDGEQLLEVPVEPLLAFAEATEVQLAPPGPPPVGVRA